MLETIRHAWNRIRTIARPFRDFDRRRWAVGLFGIVVVLLLLIAWLNYENNYVSGQFWGALKRQDAPSFATQAILYVACLR